MKTNLIALTIVLTFVTFRNAVAESYRQPAPARRAAERGLAAPLSPPHRVAANRRPGSGDLRATARTPRQEKDLDLRLAIVGGYSQLNSSDAKEQAARTSSNYNRSFYGGAQAEATIYKYIGAGVEGFYGQGPTATVTSVDRVSGTISSAPKQLKQVGGMGEATGKLPVWVGNMKLIPRAGVGFGLLQIEAASGTDSTTNRLTGPYATVGFDVWVIPAVLVSADYAMSFAGSSSSSSTSGASTSGDSRFDRIRAGAYVTVSGPAMLGAQYLRRSLKVTPAGGSDTTETTNQFLAALVLNF